LSDRGAMTALLRRVLFAGILAGLVAGLLFSVVQAAKLTPLILAAEVFETPAPHDHAAADHAAADHAAISEGPSDRLRRGALTVIANLLVAIGFGLILAGGFALRQVWSGTLPDGATGLLWGAIGFAACAAAPALSLPPELPGSVAADLAARQAWWLATALATGLGLAALAYARPAIWRIAGVALLLLPHLIGAPSAPAGEEATVPAELAARFAAGSLVMAALFWAALGWSTGRLYRRFATPPG